MKSDGGSPGTYLSFFNYIVENRIIKEKKIYVIHSIKKYLLHSISCIRMTIAFRSAIIESVNLRILTPFLPLTDLLFRVRHFIPLCVSIFVK